MTEMQYTTASPIIVGASDASPQTPVKIYVQAGRTHGLTEVGTIYYPAQLPTLLRELADRIAEPAE